MPVWNRINKERHRRSVEASQHGALPLVTRGTPGPDPQGGGGSGPCLLRLASQVDQADTPDARPSVMCRPIAVHMPQERSTLDTSLDHRHQLKVALFVLLHTALQFLSARAGAEARRVVSSSRAGMRHPRTRAQRSQIQCCSTQPTLPASHIHCAHGQSQPSTMSGRCPRDAVCEMDSSCFEEAARHHTHKATGCHCPDARIANGQSPPSPNMAPRRTDKVWSHWSARHPTSSVKRQEGSLAIPRSSRSTCCATARKPMRHIAGETKSVMAHLSNTSSGHPREHALGARGPARA